MLRGQKEVEGGLKALCGQGGHQDGLMILLIIHEAYMPVYKGSRFLLQAGGLTRGSIVQEVLADLKRSKI